MKKFIAALLFALMFVVVGSAYADIFDEDSARYYSQGTNSDGNSMFIDKNSIRHNDGNLTTYVGVMRLSNRSDLFNQARQLLRVTTQIPIYVVSHITVDCAGLRLKTGKIAILGVDTADEVENVKILWSTTSESTEWGNIPKGIEPRAKALLCGPSF